LVDCSPLRDGPSESLGELDIELGLDLRAGVLCDGLALDLDPLGSAFQQKVKSPKPFEVSECRLEAFAPKMSE